MTRSLAAAEPAALGRGSNIDATNSEAAEAMSCLRFIGTIRAIIRESTHEGRGGVSERMNLLLREFFCDRLHLRLDIVRRVPRAKG
jgi:hypothetical protein